MIDRLFFKYLQPFALLIALLIGYNAQLHANDIATVNATPLPIRFLITFDDGPSGATSRNPTQQILDVLAQNTIQPGIKAIFFIQTRGIRRGDTEVGRVLIQREQTDGHLLAFHTATPRHANHRFLSSVEFESSLKEGIKDLTAVTGVAPQLVRPPFWNYDARTLEGYHSHGLQMLLTDLSASDGVIWGINWSWCKHDMLLEHLRIVKAHWAAGKLPSIDGITPIVVTFHDVNRRTARNIEAYLKLLLQIAGELNMPVSAKPFYDNRDDLEKAALIRTVRNASDITRLPGVWNLLWQ